MVGIVGGISASLERGDYTHRGLTSANTCSILKLAFGTYMFFLPEEPQGTPWIAWTSSNFTISLTPRTWYPSFTKGSFVINRLSLW